MRIQLVCAINVDYYHVIVLLILDSLESGSYVPPRRYSDDEF
jgi:hypothetical protein